MQSTSAYEKGRFRRTEPRGCGELTGDLWNKKPVADKAVTDRTVGQNKLVFRFNTSISPLPPSLVILTTPSRTSLLNKEPDIAVRKARSFANRSADYYTRIVRETTPGRPAIERKGGNPGVIPFALRWFGSLRVN